MNRPSQAYVSLVLAAAAALGSGKGGVPLTQVFRADLGGIMKQSGRRGYKNRARRNKAACTRKGTHYRSGRR